MLHGLAPRSADPPAATSAFFDQRWASDVGDAAEAVLDIPPDLRRERRFEISCAMTLRATAC